MRKEVKIVLIGDENVGKTSIVTAAITEAPVHDDNIAPVLPPAVIPPGITEHNVVTRIVDTSSRSADLPQLKEEIRDADAICIVFALDNKESYDHIKTHWLPLVERVIAEQEQEQQQPRPVTIVIVGNKSDTRAPEELQTESYMSSVVQPLLEERKEVESFVHCSAAQNYNIRELFASAQKQVLFPMSVMFDKFNKKLTSAMINAINRIFRLLDANKDDLMSDQDLNTFQFKCFGQKMEAPEIGKLKDEIRKNVKSGITDNGLITRAGFLYLFHMLVKRARIDAAWKILQKFGYGDDLKLREDYLCPPLKQDVPVDHICQLSDEGIRFFRNLFAAYDRDEERGTSRGALSQTQLEKLYMTDIYKLPGIPQEFDNISYASNEQGLLTLNGFLSQWSLMTYKNYKTTLRYLAFLGYDGDTTEALIFTRGRKLDRQKHQTTRRIFEGYVFGGKGVGKTTFLNNFLHPRQKLKKITDEKPEPKFVVSSGKIDGIEHWMILHEFAQEEEQKVLQSDVMNKCDIGCFLYDSHDPRSFTIAGGLYEQIVEKHPNFPAMFFATKVDLGPVTQECDVTPQDLCSAHGLPDIKPLSLHNNTVAIQTLIQEIKRREETTFNKTAVVIGSFAVLIVAGVGAWYWWRRK